MQPTKFAAFRRAHTRFPCRCLSPRLYQARRRSICRCVRSRRVACGVHLWRTAPADPVPNPDRKLRVHVEAQPSIDSEDAESHSDYELGGDLQPRLRQQHGRADDSRGAGGGTAAVSIRPDMGVVLGEYVRRGRGACTTAPLVWCCE